MIHHFNLLFSFSTQAFAATTAFIVASCIVCTVLFIIFTSNSNEDKMEAKHKVYHIRGSYFFFLMFILLTGMVISLFALPYDKFQNKPDEEVTVVAMQWAWKMRPGLTNKTPAAFDGGNEITLPVNKVIKFHVTSVDVNHGFGIYSPNGLLLTQTQAMPQYNNEVSYRFKEAGDYKVLCMEYCGMPHAFMMGTIHVK